MALPSFSGDFLRLLGAKSEPEPDRYALSQYLGVLRSGAPMQWMSDHLAEDERLRGAIYVAVKVLAEQALAAECHAYTLHPEATKDGEKLARVPLPHHHPIVELLEAPNPHSTMGEILERQVQQLCLTGSALAIIARDELGMPAEIWVEPTGTYQPIPISPLYPNGGYRFLPWFPGPLASIPGVQATGGVAVPSEEVLAIRYPHPLLPAGEGLSPLSACRLSFDTLEMIDRARFSALRRGIRPSAVAELEPGSMLPDGAALDVLRLEISKLLAGPERDGALALLSPGIKLREWGGTGAGVEVGWMESWGQLVGLTLACFGVAKSLAYLDDTTSFAELYARLKQFQLFTLCPLLARISAAYNCQLIWPCWGRNYGVEFRPRKVENHTEDMEKIDRGVKAGAITRNEVRVWLGLPPAEAPWGAELAAPASPGLEEAAPPSALPPVPAPPRPRNDQGRGSLGPRIILNGSQ